MHTTHFWNNLHQVQSVKILESHKIWKICFVNKVP